jgi:hypothetical protein
MQAMLLAPCVLLQGMFGAVMTINSFPSERVLSLRCATHLPSSSQDTAGAHPLRQPLIPWWSLLIITDSAASDIP